MQMFLRSIVEASRSSFTIRELNESSDENSKKLSHLGKTLRGFMVTKSVNLKSVNKISTYSLSCPTKPMRTDVTVFETTTSKPTITLNHAHLIRVIKRVATVIQHLQQLQNTTPLRVYILPLPHRKVLVKPIGPLDPQNINGGFYAPNEHLIVIYRREEYPKVFLHEVIHAVTPTIFETLKCKRVTSRILVDEAIVETLAVIYHSALLVVGSRKQTISVIKELIERERSWCTRLKDNLAAVYDWPQKPWIEKTNAFSYIFVRSALMADLDGFIGAWLAFGQSNDATALVKYVKSKLSNIYELNLSPSLSPTKMGLQMTRYGSL